NTDSVSGSDAIMAPATSRSSSTVRAAGTLPSPRVQSRSVCTNVQSCARSTSRGSGSTAKYRAVIRTLGMAPLLGLHSLLLPQRLPYRYSCDRQGRDAYANSIVVGRAWPGSVDDLGGKANTTQSTSLRDRKHWSRVDTF